jgi:hypothetical protein
MSVRSSESQKNLTGISDTCFKQLTSSKLAMRMAPAMHENKEATNKVQSCKCSTASTPVVEQWNTCFFCGHVG